jgi:hypothetical protein
MVNIQLIHWKYEESKILAAKLRESGYSVNNLLPINQQFFKNLRANPPQIIIIDLSRLPSQGRDFAINIRSHKTTQSIPIIFTDGDPKKVNTVRQIVPDAIYSSWDEVEKAIQQAISDPPKVKPVDNVFAGYKGTPLIKKLGIKAESNVCLINAPERFLNKLGPLPESVTVHRDINGPCNLILWFVEESAELENLIVNITQVCKEQQARVWICWKKKSAISGSDVTQPIVRQTGLDNGLVDYKICSIDSTWSGLLFTRRSS